MKQCIYITIGFCMLFYGCNYLDQVPENDIETEESIFEKKSQAEEGLQTGRVFVSAHLTSLMKDPSRVGTDEVVGGDYVRNLYVGRNIGEWNGFFIADGLQMSQEPYGNVWKKNDFYAGIRYCNIFLEKLKGTYNLEESDYLMWIAEVKALKAHYYFELMRRYGPIILVPQNIEVNEPSDVMRQSRAPIDSVVNAIVNLLDEAMMHLPPMNEKDFSRQAFHNKESAATLKALTLFYAASPLFNGEYTAYAGFKNKRGDLLFPVYDKEKVKQRWKRAADAIDEALEICLRNGKSLISGNTEYPTRLLQTMADIENSTQARNFINEEAIFMLHTDFNLGSHWSMYTLPFVNSNDMQYYNPYVRSGIAPSMKMVEMYYTEHGLPISADIFWNYSDRYQLGKETNPEYRNVVSMNTTTVLNLHLRREPRFYAHIAADRCYWQRGSNITDDMIVKAYRGERYGTKAQTISEITPQNLTGYYMKKWTYSNVSNKNYHTVFQQEEGIIIMRLAELYLMKAEAWNEFLDVPDETHVYGPLNEVRRRAGILDVETAWMNYSKTPSKVRTKVGMREIIQQEWNIEFAFEGRRFWNLRRWLKAADELNELQYGWNILGQDARQFYNNYERPVVVWNKRGFIAPRDYLFPLRAEEVLISGCCQNPGW